VRIALNNVDDLPKDFWQWPHIDPVKEWACKGTGKIVVETDFLDRLEALRKTVGHPLIINSGYRSPEYNNRVAETGTTGPHTTGRAVDIRIYGPRALNLVFHAVRLGFQGIGLSQKGPFANRFVHLDDLPGDGDTPRPFVWTY
jgi:hypothetical protein